MAHSNSSSLERKKSFKRGSKKATDYFSVGSKDESDLPTFFINCVTHLEEHALDEEGILRIHGRTQDTNAINAFLLSNNTNEKRATTLGQVDPHAVATLLKSYLNQGPPLLPMEHYAAFVDIGSKKQPEGEVLLFLRDVICGIPLSHQRVLHRVLIFIDNVQQHSARNKMDTRALSIIFSPLLLRAPTEVSPAQILSQMQSSINCVHLIIQNYQAIFEGIGLNAADSPASPVLSSKDGTLRDFSSASISKDKVKVRFLLYFTIKTGGCIQDTVSLFLKYAKQGVKRETGQTTALVCTNPQEVVWEDVVPVEVTLVVNRRTKVFEPRNFVVTLKCATTKGSRTLGAASINLAELSPTSLQASPREEVKTYEMIHKGGKSKTLQLVVKSYSEWRKLNNKLVVRQEESTSSSRRPDDPASRFVTMRGRAALLSMPNLANFDVHRTEKNEDERFPLSARENKSESSILTPTKVPDNLFSSSPSTTTLSSSPSSNIAVPPSPYYYVPATTPPSLDKVPAPDFALPPHEAPNKATSLTVPQETTTKGAPTQHETTTTSTTISNPPASVVSTSVEIPSADLASSTNSGPPSPTNIIPSSSDSHSLTSSVSSTGSRSSSPITVSVGPAPVDNTPSPLDASSSPAIVSPRATSSNTNELSSPVSTASTNIKLPDASPIATTSEPSAPLNSDTTTTPTHSDVASTEIPKSTNTATDKEHTTESKEQATGDKEKQTGAKEPAKNSDKEQSSSSDKDNSTTHHKHHSSKDRHTTLIDKHQNAEEKPDTPRVRRASLKTHLEGKNEDEKHAEGNSDKSSEKDSSRKPHSRRSSPARKHSPRKHSHDSKKDEEKDAHEKSSDKDVISPRKSHSRKISPKKHSSHEDSKKEEERNTEGHEKSSEKETTRTRERSHSHPAKSERRRSEKHEKPLAKLGELAKSSEVGTHPELAVKQAEPTKHVEPPAKPSEPAAKSAPAKPAREEPKKEELSSDDQPNGATSPLRKKELTGSLEFGHPNKREKRLTITELNIPSEPSSARVSPTDEGESDLESDNDFESNPAYAQKMYELTEQIELLEQQRRQLELETFNLRKCLVHNEIYRPQTLDFSERGISSTAEQIIENLFKMNCFAEPQNFLPSFFESIIISLQQESKNEVEVPKILYWLSTTLGLLYLLSMSIKSVPDPAVHGVAILTKPIQIIDESEASNENLVVFAQGVQRTGLELYNKTLKIFEKQLDDEKLVLAFLGRPKEKEEKRNFIIKEKSSESGIKTPEPILTPAVALREILREIGENYQLLKDAKIFENFAWHMALHRLFYLDNLLVHELSAQKKLYSTDAQTIKQAALEIERSMREKFPTQSMPCPLRMTTQFVALVTAEYAKLDSETYVSNSFTLLKPSQILQILEVLRPDKDSRKPVPASVQKLLQAMAKCEADKPRVVPMTWHLSDEISKLSQAVN